MAFTTTIKGITFECDTAAEVWELVHGTDRKPNGFSNFDSLMRRIMSVPKSEIDAEMRKYKRRRKRKE